MQLQLVSEGIFRLSESPLCATAYKGEDNFRVVASLPATRQRRHL
jgi:hypothetical protein